MSDRPGDGPIVRVLDQREVRAGAETLAAGFFNDPVLSHALPDGGRRFEQLRDMFAIVLEHGGLVDGTVWCDDGVHCVAHWTSPEGRAGSDERVAAHGEAFAAVLSDGLAAVAQMESAMAAVHPHEPHWYLGMVATEPGHQGRGLCTAVLAPALARCDDDVVPAYLESTNEANIPLYRRLGFEVTGVIRPWAEEGPAMWSMWREPRPG